MRHCYIISAKNGKKSLSEKHMQQGTFWNILQIDN